MPMWSGFSEATNAFTPGINLDVLQRCGAIIRTGSGTDNVPVREATQLGIVVANTPDALTECVSDHAIQLCLASSVRPPSRTVPSAVETWERSTAWLNWHLHRRTHSLALGESHRQSRVK